MSVNDALPFIIVIIVVVVVVVVPRVSPGYFPLPPTSWTSPCSKRRPKTKARTGLTMSFFFQPPMFQPAVLLMPTPTPTMSFLHPPPPPPTIIFNVSTTGAAPDATRRRQLLILLHGPPVQAPWPTAREELRGTTDVHASAAKARDRLAPGTSIASLRLWTVAAAAKPTVPAIRGDSSCGDDDAAAAAAAAVVGPVATDQVHTSILVEQGPDAELRLREALSVAEALGLDAFLLVAVNFPNLQPPSDIKPPPLTPTPSASNNQEKKDCK
ncbi:hypothetical protein L249_0347 [Ophiocordyceps polyrhachis-furcata BCC 54312]|uniref:Uncharacterized protein n=1 Tax=Ophiocordyceps polyrhachis-furcata BCC 54312 TaxID=1330021 RepID=A0A367LFQ7_9HYPO|nr:hypothetical protein L249_0347 [Ophiocordyceps polyrhachis-furcata BCC 54312]